MSRLHSPVWHAEQVVICQANAMEKKQKKQTKKTFSFDTVKQIPGKNVLILLNKLDKLPLSVEAGMAWFNVKVYQPKLKEPVFEISTSGGWPDDLFWLPVLHLTGAGCSDLWLQHKICQKPRSASGWLVLVKSTHCDVPSNKDVSWAGFRGARLHDHAIWRQRHFAGEACPTLDVPGSRSPLHLVVHDIISRKVHMVMKWMLASSRYEIPVVIMPFMTRISDDFIMLAWHHKDKGDAFYFIDS